MKTRQEIIWQIISIILCLLFIPVIVFNIALTIQGALNPDKLPAVFGFAPTPVASGSMSGEFEENDLIFIKRIDADTLKAQEDVICFYDADDGAFTTHRIERIEEVDGVKHFYTKGDANNSEDSGFVLAEQIQGKYVGKIAGLGGAVMFMQSPYGLILTIILLIMLYIAGELLIEWIQTKRANIKLKAELEDMKAKYKIALRYITTKF